MPQSEPRKETVARVMHEAKHGELKAAGERRMRNPRQAIAIALHEAGASRDQTPRGGRRTLAKTKRKEQRGETARDAAEGTAGETGAALYAEATRRARAVADDARGTGGGVGAGVRRGAAASLSVEGSLGNSRTMMRVPSGRG